MPRKLSEPAYTIPGKEVNMMSEAHKTDVRMNNMLEHLTVVSVEDSLRRKDPIPSRIANESTKDYVSRLTLYALQRSLELEQHPGTKDAIQVLCKRCTPSDMSEAFVAEIESLLEQYKNNELNENMEETHQ